jgi:hypothetical protein
LVDYRTKLEEEARSGFRDILEEAWTWDEIADDASFPFWPYVGEDYGNDGRILIVGRAHEQWPSTTVGPDERAGPHLKRFGGEVGLSRFKDRHSLEDIEAALDELRWMNETFIREVKEEDYDSNFWHFTRRFLDTLGLSLDSFAWANTYPFCRHPQGMPEEPLKERLRRFRGFVGEVAEILDAQVVLILGSGDWQSNAKAMFPFDWKEMKAPLSTWKTDTWTRAGLPWGGSAIRSWHPGRLSRRDVESFADQAAERSRSALSHQA